MVRVFDGDIGQVGNHATTQIFSQRRTREVLDRRLEVRHRAQPITVSPQSFAGGDQLLSEPDLPEPTPSRKRKKKASRLPLLVTRPATA